MSPPPPLLSSPQVSLLTDAVEARQVLHAALQRLGLTRALQTAAVELAVVARTLEAGSPQGADDLQQQQAAAGTATQTAGAATQDVAAAAALSAARQAQQACAELQRALMLHSVHHGDATAVQETGASQRCEKPAASSCSCSSDLVALAAELEALKVKAAKAIAYGRHRAGQYEQVLLQGLQDSSGRQAAGAGAASEEAAVAGFRCFWASVEKQLARLLGACHKAAATAAATAAAAASDKAASGAMPQAPDMRHESASPPHLQPLPLPALGIPIAAASRTPINAARRTPPRASNAVLQVGVQRRLVCAIRYGDGLVEGRH